MSKYFVDSNVFLRFYSKDDEKQRQQVKAMLLNTIVQDLGHRFLLPFHPFRESHVGSLLSK